MTATAATCSAELWDGNPDDPSYAYCGRPAGHAGAHGDWAGIR